MTTTRAGGSTAAEAPASDLKAGLVSDVGKFNDRSFNQSALEGLERAQEELGVEGRPIESVAAGDYIANLTTLARDDYDLTIGVGFLMADAMNTVATQFPESNFAIVDFPNAALKSKPANVRGLTFATNENSYLIGYMAAKMADAEGGKPVDQRGRRPQDPDGRHLHRRLQGGRQGGRSRTSRCWSTTRRTSSPRRSARRRPSTRSPRARRSSSRWPAAAASARCRRPPTRASGASASTATSPTSATTSSPAP